MDSLFDLPADQIDLEVIRSFLALPIETVTMELKESWSQSLLSTVAAFANTRGGILLLGVKEGLPLPDSLIGVGIEEQLRVQNSCRGRLQPPIQPEIIPVPLDQPQRFVLVIRVDPSLMERPVVMNGKVYVRQSGGNIGADRAVIRSLFAEGYAAGGVEVDSVAHPRFWYGEDYRPEGPDLVLQVSVSFPLRESQRAGFMLSSSFRRQLAEVLASSRVTQWFGAMMLHWSLKEMAGWRLHGQMNTSEHLELALTALLPDERGASFRLHSLCELGRTQLAASFAAVFLNEQTEKVWREKSGGPSVTEDDSLKVARIRPIDIHSFFQAAMEALWVTLPQETLNKFVSPPLWRTNGPIATVSGRNDRGVAGRLQLGVPDGSLNKRAGDDFLPELEVQISSPLGRMTLSRFWIEKLLLDVGVADAHGYLEEL